MGREGRNKFAVLFYSILLNYYGRGRKLYQIERDDILSTLHFKYITNVRTTTNWFFAYQIAYIGNMRLNDEGTEERKHLGMIAIRVTDHF